MSKMRTRNTTENILNLAHNFHVSTRFIARESRFTEWKTRETFQPFSRQPLSLHIFSRDFSEKGKKVNSRYLVTRTLNESHPCCPLPILDSSLAFQQQRWRKKRKFAAFNRKQDFLPVDSLVFTVVQWVQNDENQLNTIFTFKAKASFLT